MSTGEIGKDAGDHAQEMSEAELEKKLSAITTQGLMDSFRRCFAKVSGLTFDETATYLDTRAKSSESKFYLELALDNFERHTTELHLQTCSSRYELGGIVVNSHVRLDQEERILGDLRKDNRVLVRGNWRIGKTSMLVSIANKYFDKKHFLYMDLGGYTDHRLKEEAIIHIADFIAKIDSHGATFDAIKSRIEQNGRDPFEYLKEYIDDNKMEILVGIDEVIGLEKKEDFEYIANIPNILKNTPTLIVLHRKASLENMLGEVFSKYQTHFIRSILPSEIDQIVEKPITGSGIIFTESAKKALFEACGGRPMEINNLCHRIIDPDFNKDHKMTFDESDVRYAIEQEFKEAASLRAAFSTYKRIYEIALSANEQEILLKILEKDQKMNEIDAELVQPLIDTNIVARDGARDVYKINGYILAEALRRIVKLSNETALNGRNNGVTSLG